MNISYVGGQVGGFPGTTSDQTINFALTGGLASVPDADDLVVVSYAISSNSNIGLTIKNASAVAYTLIGSELYSNDDLDTNLRVAYRFMPGTPETTVVLSDTTNVDWAGAYTIHVYRGVDTATPMDVAVTSATGIDTRFANPPAITPITPGAWIQVSGAGAASTGAVFTSSDMSDFRTYAQADVIDIAIGSGYKSDWTSGAFDPAVFGGGADNISNSWAAVTLVLRPASESSDGGLFFGSNF